MAAYSDDFNRSDGAIGSNWTVESFSNVSVAGNHAICDGDVNDRGQAHYNSAFDSEHHRSEVTFLDGNADYYIAFCSGDGGFTFPRPNGYVVMLWTAVGGLYSLWRTDSVDGDDSLVGDTGFTFPTPPFTLAIEHTAGGVVTVYIDDVELFDYTDTTPLTGTYAGFGWYGVDTATVAEADNWAGVDVGGPTDYDDTDLPINIVATVTSTDAGPPAAYDDTDLAINIAATFTVVDVGPGAAWELIASLGQGSTDGNGFTTSAIDTTGADLIVINIADYNGLSTISDSNSNTWPSAVGPAGIQPRSELFFCFEPTVGSGHTFTVTATGEFPSIFVQAWSGADTTVGTNDQENSAGGFGNATQQPGSVTPSTDNQLIVTGMGYASASAPGIDLGFAVSNYVGIAGGQHWGGGFAYLVQASAAAINPTWGSPGTDYGGATIATFEGSGAAPPPAAYDDTDLPINIAATFIVDEVGGVPFADTNLPINIAATFQAGNNVHVPVVQEGFRWRNDDGDEDGATWIAAADTNATIDIGETARLRMLVDNAVPSAYTLYYKKTTDSIWEPVPVGSGGSVPVYIAASANITAGGEATTAQLTAPTGKTTGDFAVGRMWDNENGVDIVPGEFVFAEPFNDLDRWTAARQRSEVGNTPAAVGWLQNFTPASLDNVEPPDDVVIHNGQVWIGAGSQNYGDTTIRCNQPFEFASGGVIEVDVWVPNYLEALKGWPHLTITDVPYTSPSAKSDNSNGPVAQYGFEVRFNHAAAVYGDPIEGTVFRPAPQTVIWDDHVEILDVDDGIGLGINMAPTTMTHVRIEFDHDHIDIYADGALWYDHDWTLPPELTSGWLYLACHNHATIKYGWGANNYSVFDNLRFTGANVTPHRCWPAPDNIVPIPIPDGEFGTNGVDIGWALPATVTIPDVPAGVTAARLLCTTTVWGGFVDGSALFTYALNGETPHDETYAEWDGSELNSSGVTTWSIPVDVDELVVGDNEIDFSHTTISGQPPSVSNVQLLTEGGS